MQRSFGLFWTGWAAGRTSGGEIGSLMQRARSHCVPRFGLRGCGDGKGRGLPAAARGFPILGFFWQKQLQYMQLMFTVARLLGLVA